MPQVRGQPLLCETHLYDTRGHARSEALPHEHAYGWDCLVSDFGDVVGKAQKNARVSGAHKPVVGGLSLGAATALFWTLEHRELVSGLVLAAYPECSPQVRKWAVDFADRIDANGLDSAGHHFVWGPQGRFCQEDAQLVRRGFLQHSPLAISSILRNSLGQIPDIPTLVPALTHLQLPVLVVVGSRDESSMSASREIVRALPNVRLAVIEGAGHVVNLSRPGAFNQIVANFMAICASS